MNGEAKPGSSAGEARTHSGKLLEQLRVDAAEGTVRQQRDGVAGLGARAELVQDGVDGGHLLRSAAAGAQGLDDGGEIQAFVGG